MVDGVSIGHLASWADFIPGATNAQGQHSTKRRFNPERECHWPNHDASRCGVSIG